MSIRSEYSSASRLLHSEYHSLRTVLRSEYEGAARYLKSDYEGARCLFQAYLEAQLLAPAAIYQETGYELKSLLEGLIPGLLQVLAVVGATTFIGAAVGGIIGFFFGGVGAAPGAVIGGELGFDVGTAVLTWLGLGFLVVAIARGFGEMLDALRKGVQWAWAAGQLSGVDEERQVHRAAQELARASGIMMRLILEGIVAYLLKEGAVGATRGAMSTAGALRTVGAEATADEIVAGLAGKLRVSRLGRGFGDWVERNWRDLTSNPRLRLPEIPTGTSVTSQARPQLQEIDKVPQAPGRGQQRGASSAVTESPVEEPPAKPTKPRKPRRPSGKNKNIDHSRTIYSADGSTTYYDLEGRAVTYDSKGYPDFSPYAEAEVKINGLRGTIPPDDALANQAVGLDSTPDGYTWHHVEDGQTMQLVPSDIHGTFPHTGGASLIRGQ